MMEDPSGAKRRFRSLVFFFTLVPLCLPFLPGAARASAFDPSQRVRIAECFNSPQSAILLLQMGDAFLGLSDLPPVWRTLTAETEEERRDLERASVAGVYDMVITSDARYAERLREQGLLRALVPIYTERLLLVGPPDWRLSEGARSAGEIMAEIFKGESLFFSSLYNQWLADAEKELWARANIARPSENKNYVESGHDDIGLLIQAEEERGFALAGEASFAQYLAMRRGAPALVLCADTGVVRTTAVCLIAGSDYRKARAGTADRYVGWLRSEPGASLIEAFSLGGTAPFRAVTE